MNKAEAIAARDAGALTQILRAEFQPDKIPRELKAHKAFLCWRAPAISEKRKVQKVPVYAATGKNRHGKQGSPEDLDGLATWDEAMRRFADDPSIAGLGFATLEQFGITALDFDNCINPETGTVSDDIVDLISGTYAEISPSGNGIRAFLKGTAADGKNHEEGFELFGTTGFVTITGVGYFPDQPEALQVMDDALREAMEKKAKAKQKQKKAADPLDTDDPILQQIIARRLFIKMQNDSTAYIECPLNHLHSDPDRPFGGGDATYMLPNHNGYPHGMFFCSHTHHEKGMEYQSKYLEAMGYNPFGALAEVTKTLTRADPVDVAALQNVTQDNVALVFARLFRERLRYVPQMGWRVWDGTRWAPDALGRAHHFAREVIRAANREGKASPASISFCEGVEKMARRDPALAVEASLFDRDNYLLNTPAGTFDLRTNVMRQHSPDDHLSKTTAVSPTEEGGGCFQKFLREVTGGDEELVRFLQVALGACLSGAIEAHWLLFWTGVGRNGKNTLGDLVMFILGEYAKKIPVTTLMEARHAAHPTELASLAGVRLATSSEIASGAHWNESRINEITGDAMISARYMGRDFFEFQRTHKHLIYGNHRPQLRSITAALKSRLLIVPFKQNFAGREDLELPAKLRAEAGYVLGWLITGHSEWLRLGRRLPPCAAVAAETEDYFACQSTPDLWVAERLELLPNDTRMAKELPGATELYTDYRIWKEKRGEQPLATVRWGEFMSGRFAKEKPHGVVYRGCQLRGHGALAALAGVAQAQNY